MKTGYVFQHEGSAFAPTGRVQMSAEEAAKHNQELAKLELASLKATGRGVLYLFYRNGSPTEVGTWASKPDDRFTILRFRRSKNNWGAQRTDVWFQMDGDSYHGVNIGDNDICRVKALGGAK